MKFLIILCLPILVFSQFTIEEISESELKNHQMSSSFEIQPFDFSSNIDVLHYTLRINANPESVNFSGISEIEFKALSSTSQLTFDASDLLNISAITMNGISLLNQSTHNNDVVTVNLPNSLNANDIRTIKFYYNSSANNAYYQEMHEDNSIVYTLSEPYFAKQWYVCKDNLSDKADNGVDVYINHPSDQKAASNGVLIGVQNNGNGTSTTHWKHSYPIASYLVAIAVTNYVEYNNSVTISGNNIPIINYLYPESNIESNQLLLNNVPYYITFLNNTFGEYPYKLEKYGHAEWPWSGGMEHATMSFVSGFNRNLVVHELAHQWFGDKITCGTWQDIWLNEGFATYCSGLIVENQDGMASWDAWKSAYLGVIMSYPDGSVYINNVQDIENQYRIFNFRLSYAKGALVLHMLRFLLGDNDFFLAIRNYLADTNLAYGFAITPQLQMHLENVSGMDLDGFFSDWVYGEGFPTFDFELSSHINGGYTLHAQQSSNNPNISLYEIPYEITFYGNSGQSLTKRFNCNSTDQYYAINDIPFQVTSYVFNPHFDVIAQSNNTLLNTNEMDDLSTDLKIYPNPANDFVNLKSDQAIKNIYIMDVSGKLIYEASINDFESTISTKNWPKGVYLISVETEKGTSSKKLILE